MRPKAEIAKRGFTLVELLVVIPRHWNSGRAVAAGRASRAESARRKQCVNHLKQIGLASQLVLDTYNTFPSAGIGPWPPITLRNKAVVSPDEQEIGWGFQILPYIEEKAIQDLRSPIAVAHLSADRRARRGITKVSYYFCPSRRAPTTQDRRYLMDYASSVPTHLALDSTSARYLIDRDTGVTRSTRRN